MAPTRASRLSVALLTLRLFDAQPAAAEAASADTLFVEGREELAKGNYDVACEKLKRSDELEPAPGTKLNLGECEALRGRVATAYTLFLLAEQQLSPTDVRSPIARSKREALLARLPRLRVTLARGAPPNTSISVGERRLSSDEYGRDIPLDPGSWEIVVTAPNLAAHRLKVLLEEGKTLNFTAQPPQPTTSSERVGSSPTPPLARRRTGPAGAPRVAPPTASSSSKGLLALGLGISATALASVSGILTLQAKSDNDGHCDETKQSCDATGRAAATRGRILGGVTTLGLVAGGIGIGLGTYWILDGKGPNVPSASLAVQSDGVRAVVELTARL